jgi:cell division GTPase FtsZ
LSQLQCKIVLVSAATRLTELSGLLLLQIPGLVNVDFADVRTIMSNAGTSLMGQGCASGKGRAREAALQVRLGSRFIA